MPDSPESLIRRLGRRYAMVLFVVAGVLICDQAILQPLMIRLNGFAPAINLAGRQRMLSQRIVKETLALQLRPGESAERSATLLQDLATWQRVHEGLRFGDVELRLPKPNDPRIAKELEALEPLRARISRDVSQLVEAPADHARISELLAAEQAFLPAMERIVQRIEEDSRQQVARLRRIAIVATAAVITLMAGLYWLVLRPAVTLIRMQVNRLSAHERELEQRVSERTRQLTETNAALAAAAEEGRLGDQRNLNLQMQLAQVSRITSLGELATGIAHEINQPLGAIANDSETLLILLQKREADRGGVWLAAERIRDSAQRAGMIIRRMRNFVRSREHLTTVERINPLIRDVCALCEPDLRSHGIALDLALDATADLSIKVDPIGIQQVLVNLLRNAVQAMEQQPAFERTLRVSTVLENPMVLIEVEDDGPGFTDDPGELPRLLQSSKKDGLGLGLSISQSIVVRHGGKLELQNRSEGGARARVALPVFNSLGERRAAADRICCR